MGDNPDLLKPAEAAEFLGIRPETLCRWRLRGEGPRWLKNGRWVRYRRADVMAYLTPAE